MEIRLVLEGILFLVLGYPCSERGSRVGLTVLGWRVVYKLMHGITLVEPIYFLDAFLQRLLSIPEWPDKPGLLSEIIIL